MPGVILLGGHRDAAELARAAAAPLSRRDWETVTLASAPNAAVGVAGERGAAVALPDGLLVALEGEVYGERGTMSGGEAVELIAGEYRRHGARMPTLNGEFAVAIWDPHAERAVLVTDALGTRPIYVAEGVGYALAAGELKALVPGGLRPELDPQGAAEMLSYEKPRTPATMLRGARRLGGGVALELDGRGAELSFHRHFRFRIEPERMDTAEALDELWARAGRAIGRRLDGATVLALSGGLDSRWMAHEVAQRRPGTLAVTYGTEGAEELSLAARAARLVGLPHQALALTPGYLADWAARTVWLSDGSIRCFHAHHLALVPLRQNAGARSVLIGLSGDDVVRLMPAPAAGPTEADFVRAASAVHGKYLPDRLAEAALHPAFAAEMRGLAYEGYARALGAVEGPSRTARIGELVVRPQATIFADHLAPRDPFADIEVLDLCRRLPTSLRDDGTAERALLADRTSLAWLRSSKDGIPPALRGSARRVALGAVGARRSLRSRLDRRLGPGWAPTHAGFADYASDLRAAGRGLLGILLADRTLDRRQFDRRWLQARIDETLAGRARNTHALSVMLTLELFQRQFIDGDGPPGLS